MLVLILFASIVAVFRTYLPDKHYTKLKIKICGWNEVLSNQPTWSRVSLENLIFLQLVKIFSVFYGS
jgi:hypothetical protein